MALRIRLSRGGAKKRPYYRVVVADGRFPRDGRFIERIGTYNPLLPKDAPERVKLDLERAKFWISRGATPSDRVLRFLDAAGVMTRAARNNPLKGLPGKKRQEREEEAKAAAEEAKQKAADEAKAAAEAPAEEAPAEEPAAEAPAAEAKTEEASAAEAPAEEAPAEEAKAEEPKAEEAPAGDEETKKEDAAG